MKKLLLSLVVLATIFSCGKNNSVSSNSSSVSGLSSSLTSSSSATNLANAINNNTFGTTFSTVLSTYPVVRYYYNTSSVSSSSSSTSCVAKVGGVCLLTWSYSGSLSSNSGTNSIVYNSSVAVSTKQSELMSLLNSVSSTSSIIQPNTSVGIYYITVGTKIYTIDTTYPIQSNPIQEQDSSAGTIKRFYYMSWGYN